MGVDVLDFTFRIEKAFEIKKISREDFDKLFTHVAAKRDPHDVTAGELHQWVLLILNERGMKIPYSSWTRVRLTLAGVVSKPPQIIHKETLIRRDLDFH